jgi:hypothetical protein
LCSYCRDDYDMQIREDRQDAMDKRLAAERSDTEI